MEMRDDGEPISRGQLDRRAAEGRAFRDALFAAAFFAGVILVNGMLAMLLIELIQVIGWWESSASDGRSATLDLSGCLRARPAATG
jgi:hypothetical protein